MKCGDLANPDGPGRKSNGDYCGNPVMPGATRCHLHGAKAPEALMKAKTQLALLRMPAIEALHQSIEQLVKILEQYQNDPCTACGYPKGDDDAKQVIIKACAAVARISTSVLDRTDVGPKATLEVKQSDFDLDLRNLDAKQQQRLDEILAQYEALKADVRQALHGIAFGVDASPTVM